MPLDIRRIKTPEANQILNGEHYLGECDYAARYCLTTAERDALAVFSSPMAAHFKRRLVDPLELTRLWQDDFQRRPLSQFLAETCAGCGARRRQRIACSRTPTRER